MLNAKPTVYLSENTTDLSESGTWEISGPVSCISSLSVYLKPSWAAALSCNNTHNQENRIVPETAGKRAKRHLTENHPSYLLNLCICKDSLKGIYSWLKSLKVLFNIHDTLEKQCHSLLEKLTKKHNKLPKRFPPYGVQLMICSQTFVMFQAHRTIKHIKRDKRLRDKFNSR